jgi:hypothetical protein
VLDDLPSMDDARAAARASRSSPTSSTGVATAELAVGRPAFARAFEMVAGA